MNDASDKNKSGRKSRLKDRIFGSTSSIRSSKSKATVEIPEELSLEEAKSKDGFLITYLRVYCEKVRVGDHFKTLKVYGSTTAERCVKELMDTYFSRLGVPEDFGLYEVMGRIEFVTVLGENQDPQLRFSEVCCRYIQPHETIFSIFQGTRAGPGLSRRIELRKLDTINHPSSSNAAQTANRRPSVTSPCPTPLVPLARRSMTPNGVPLLRDSRAHRGKNGLRVPHGPHLILLRGCQPKLDGLVHDLTSIIQKNRLRSELTIGSRSDASIRTYEPPDDFTTPTPPIIYAKLVGYDYPLTNDGSSVNTGAIFIEPYFNEQIDVLQPFSFPEIYINEELLNPGPDWSFEKRLLRPGDFLHFGSVRHGYVFLFKDPRWIPDHCLDLGTMLPNIATNTRVGTALSSTPLNATNPKPVQNGIASHGPMVHSDRSSDTDSSVSRRRAPSLTFGEQLPRLASLRQVLTPLFPQILPQPPNQLMPTDPLDSPRWTKIEPWRSAGLFAHLVRTAAGFIVQPNPHVPNRDVEDRNTKSIQDYAINYLKDMRALLTEFCQTIVTKSPDLVVPHLWLTLFAYNVAIYLSPGWLVNSEFGVRRMSRDTRLTPSRDGRDSSESSPNSNLDNNGTSIESLLVVNEVRDSAYKLACESINIVVRLTFEELSPYLKDFLNGPGSRSALSEYYGDGSFFPNNSTDFPELRNRLCKLVNSFQLAFNPDGLGEGESVNSAASSPFHTASTDSLNRSNLGLDNGVKQTTRKSKPRGQSCSTAYNLDNSDQSLSPATDSDTGDHATPYGRPQSRPTGRTSRMSSLNGRDSINTSSRIEAVVWRHVLASISHHLLYTLVTNDSIPIDWETGNRLLRALNWLCDWLRSQNLYSHRRPLNMITEFANLLATPRENLFKMSWVEMRSFYPEIQPSLLKFLLDEYEVDGEIKAMPAWHADQRDANDADEDTRDVLDRVLNTWRSKESLLYSRTHHQSVPLYRPCDLWDLFNLPGTVELERRLDQQLEIQRIEFRWNYMIRRNPGARALPSMPEADQDTVNQTQIQQRQTIGRRNRALNALRANGPSPGPRRELAGSNPNLERSETPNYHTKNRRHTQDHLNSAPVIVNGNNNDRSSDSNGLRESLRPAPSKGEPIRIIRTYNNEQPERKIVVPSKPSTPLTDAALYHLEGLAASLPHANFSQLLAYCQRPPTATGEQENMPNTGTFSQRYPRYDSQPNLNEAPIPHSQMNGFHGRPYSPAMTEYSPMAPIGNRFQPNNRLAQSLWQLPMDDTKQNEALRGAETAYGRQVAAASQDWEAFKLAMLRRGLDRVRSPVTAPQSATSRHPMRGLVSSSLGNLHMMLPPQSAPYTNNPSIIVEETNGGSTPSLAMSPFDQSSSILGRNDDLGDVMSRSTQGSLVSNITLTRSPETGFGMTLVDGERTHLDQPGVFIKSILPNSPAALNGELGLGDRIIAINGSDLTGMTYNDSLAMLKSCKTQATFTIRHCTLSDPTLLLERKKS